MISKHDRLAFAGLFVTLFAAMVAGCGDTEETEDTTDEPPFDPTTADAMWCGDLDFIVGNPYENWSTTSERTEPNTPAPGENVCFLVFFEPVGNPGGAGVRQPDEGFFEPVRVTYFFYAGESADNPATTCTITGVDENGSELGYSIAIDPDNSRCEWYAPGEISTGEYIFPYTTQISGTFEQTSVSITPGEPRLNLFSLRATGRMNYFLEETGNWLFGRVFDSGIGFSVAHDGSAFPLSYSPPSQLPVRGDCDANGSYQVQYGEPEILVGGEYTGCTDVATGAGSPSVSYDVIDDGLFADNGQEFMRFIPVPAGSCSFLNQAEDPRWGTLIDYDTRTAYVTYTGMVLRDGDGGGLVDCRIVWEGDLGG